MSKKENMHIWNEETIRAEISRLDTKTGLRAADLPIHFNNAKCTLGSFSENPLFFCFSKYWFHRVDWPVECALDVIRHEYAHYYDFIEYGGSGHGKTWKKCCLLVGANPRRLYSEEREKYYRDKHIQENELNKKFDMYKQGSLLLHPKYDFGKIVSIEGENLNRYIYVEFEEGIKRLSLKWVVENCEVEFMEKE